MKLLGLLLPMLLTLGLAGHARGEEQPASAAETSPTVATVTPPASPVAAPMTDEQFLDEWQRRCFLFLWEQADPATGLVADRAPADGSKQSKVASIASVGFALTGIAIADTRGWITKEQAYDRTVTTLRFLRDRMPHERGFYYHFVDIHTGERVWECELSSVDTALLMAGVLTVRQHFKGTEVETLATDIYHRVDWNWMRNGGRTLSMGWKPESGFINAYWDHYSEHLVLQLLALGSPTQPIPAEAWHAWRRYPLVEYDGLEFLSYPPLFVHQFSHAWIDFRGLRDDYADYWTNSVLATKAHRAMCMKMADRFPHYGPNAWGITSSDSEYGYTAWGGPDPSPHVNGTLVPCAPAGSIPFLPEASIAAVRHMHDTWGDRIWKKYGLVDAFNPHTGWIASDVIGIDVGITLVMIENHRSELVWRLFMANPEIQAAMGIAGFRPAGDAQPGRFSSVYSRELSDAAKLPEYLKTRRLVVPRSDDKDAVDDWQTLDRTMLESGRPTERNHVDAKFSFRWSDEALHLTVDVVDPKVLTSEDASKMYQKDSVELYIDPQNDGLAWGDQRDFQFGFSVPNQVWEWFGQRQGVNAQVTKTDTGYRVESAIPFAMIDVKPQPGATLSASVAVNNSCPDTSEDVKLNWSWRPHVQKIYLGELTLAAPPAPVADAAPEAAKDPAYAASPLPPAPSY